MALVSRLTVRLLFTSCGSRINKSSYGFRASDDHQTSCPLRGLLGGARLRGPLSFSGVFLRCGLRVHAVAGDDAAQLGVYHLDLGLLGLRTGKCFGGAGLFSRFGVRLLEPALGGQRTILGDRANNFLRLTFHRVDQTLARIICPCGHLLPCCARSCKTPFDVGPKPRGASCGAVVRQIPRRREANPIPDVSCATFLLPADGRSESTARHNNPITIQITIN
ncbi:hypothetical protein [Mycobacterium sp.]|uniref:hypothetical protein n=1 Tax=Mycobacterium sp. TaxID=1785 RepID=UPI0033405AC1